MVSEIPFRITLAFGFAVVLVIGIIHRWRAAVSGEKISHQEEGCLFAIILRLMGLCTWIAMLVYLTNSAAIQWATIPLHPGVRWAGVGLGAAGTVLLYWTLSSLGKNLTDTVVTRAEATLVTHGPYRWVRHPFYVTGALLLVAVTLVSANWLIGLCGSLVLTLLAIRTPKEEQMLIARFGQQYTNYMTKTGQFVPKVFGNREAN